MSFAADSLRSTLRKKWGDSLLSAAKMLGLPAMTQVRDGFRVKAVNLGGIKKVSITAPMGAAVAVGQPDGIRLFIAEYFASSFTPLGLTHIGDYPFKVGKFLFAAANKYKTTNFAPTVSVAPTPALLPHMGEAFWLGQGAFTPTDTMPARAQLEISLNIYFDKGRAPKRTAVVAQNNNFVNAPVQMQPFVYTGQTLCRTIAATQNEYGIEDDGAMRVLGYCLETDIVNGISAEPLYALIWFYGLPEHIRNALAYTATPNPHPIWTFAYDRPGQLPTVLHACNTSDYIASLHEDPPVNDKWRLFFTFYTLGTGTITTFNADNFIGVLDSLAPSYGIITNGNVNWGKAYVMLRQLIGHPVKALFVWPDTYTFAHGEDVYTWTRKYGSVKFSRATGLTTTSLVVPSVVDAVPGTRPTMVKMTDSIYFCSADKLCKQTPTSGEEDPIGVLGIYTGSPFTGWIGHPLPPAEYTLRHVRPIALEEDGVRCMGVVHKANDNTWNFCMLANGVWHILGELDIQVENLLDVSFSTCLYGDHPDVAELMSRTPQPPPMYYIPSAAYSLYESLLP